MKGTFIQLVAYGVEDLHMKQDPEITFFKKVYKRHTPFSMESIEQVLIDTPSFGNMSTITIKREGDLVSSMYLYVTLPFDQNLTDSYWTNRVGFNLLQKVELYIGKRLVDRVYGLWCHIWTELTQTIDKKNILDRLVGTTGASGTSNGISVVTEWTLVIPLMFSFCRNKGSAIPLVALNAATDITLKVFFQKKENCIQTGFAPSGNITKVSLWVDYIFLERLENLNIAQRPVEYLIEVTQHLRRNLITSGVKSIALPFTLSTKELMWVVQNKTPAGDKFTDFTYNNMSMVTSVQFNFNSKRVFSSGSKPNDYFNYIIPYFRHTGYPDFGINAYSFAIYPEQLDPSGIINFSHLNTATINIETGGNGILDIFALSYNILRIENGNATLIYNY
jgi:hypothetical protein